MRRVIYTCAFAAAAVLCLWVGVAVVASLFLDLGPDVDEHGPREPKAPVTSEPRS